MAIVVLFWCCETNAQNTIPAGCLTAPFPTDPSGPARTIEGGFGGGDTGRITVWRKPCAGNSAATLVTIEPFAASSPFVCSSSVTLVQGGAQYSQAGLYTSLATTSTFCNDLFVKTTFLLLERGTNTAFNPGAGFTFIFDPAGTGPNLITEVGAYNAADYGSTTNIVITGKQSGSWFDPARSGDGFLLEIGSTGATRTFIASWYTYNNGVQQWIFGSATLPAGATSVTVQMVTTSGASFGSAFRASDVVSSPWGSVTFTFTGCNSMQVAYAKTGGESGAIAMQRILTQIDGYACP